MNHNLWKSAVLCAFLLSSARPSAFAQNATSGGDQQSQPDVQTGAQTGNAGTRRGPVGPGQGGIGARRAGGAIRGTVTAVSGANVTVKDEQGATWTVVTTDNTRVMRGRQTLPLSGVQSGDELMAMGVPDADKHEVHAMMVMDVSAADVAKAKANMGKTYIVGRITAIDETKVTVMRTDKVSQAIQLDETTSLHKGGRMNPEAMQAMGLDAGMMGGGMGGMGGGMGMGGPGGGRRGGQAGAAPANEDGEAITLADVKVGDSVVGIGSVKGGSFVPTDLRVQDRPIGGGPGGRRIPAGSDTPPPPPQ
jgi:hypothetical protein